MASKKKTSAPSPRAEGRDFEKAKEPRLPLKNRIRNIDTDSAAFKRAQHDAEQRLLSLRPHEAEALLKAAPACKMLAASIEDAFKRIAALRGYARRTFKKKDRDERLGKDARIALDLAMDLYRRAPGAVDSLLKEIIDDLPARLAAEKLRPLPAPSTRSTISPDKSVPALAQRFLENSEQFDRIFETQWMKNFKGWATDPFILMGIQMDDLVSALRQVASRTPPGSPSPRKRSKQQRSGEQLSGLELNLIAIHAGIWADNGDLADDANSWPTRRAGGMARLRALLNTGNEPLKTIEGVLRVERALRWIADEVEGNDTLDSAMRRLSLICPDD